jgi:hypothetical protein
MYGYFQDYQALKEEASDYGVTESGEREDVGRLGLPTGYTDEGGGEKSKVVVEMVYRCIFFLIKDEF